MIGVVVALFARVVVMTERQHLDDVAGDVAEAGELNEDDHRQQASRDDEHANGAAADVNRREPPRCHPDAEVYRGRFAASNDAGSAKTKRDCDWLRLN